MACLVTKPKYCELQLLSEAASNVENPCPSPFGPQTERALRVRHQSYNSSSLELQNKKDLQATFITLFLFGQLSDYLER